MNKDPNMNTENRVLQKKDLAYDHLFESFDDALNDYDTARRVEVLVNEFLPSDLTGKSVLEVGTGLGFFAKALSDKGAIVTATDISPKCVAHVGEKVGCESLVADAMNLQDQLGDRTFDIVLSSECVEHTPNPAEAVKQISSRVAEGGQIVLSTPNYLWQPVVKIATLLRLRKFDGFENFLTWGNCRKAMESTGIQIEKEKGLHLFPFQIPLHSLSRRSDENLQFMRKLMINMCFSGFRRG